MRQDESYPAPVSDPASEGIPEYADDDSTAYDDVDSPRVADGRSPAPLPADRDEGPVGLDDVATTAEGQRRGGSLEDRLAEEEPDISPDDLPTPRSALLDEATGEDQPDADSPVSMYDRPGLDPVSEGRVGRLVQPDQGAHSDTEADEVAQDAGAAGGGASAEELAMHAEPEE